MTLANAGIPMLAIELPALVIALGPIIVLEAWILSRMCDVEWPIAWRGTATANILSTLVGIPLAWLAQLVLQLSVGGGTMWDVSTLAHKIRAVLLQSAWLPPYEVELPWMIPAAALLLLPLAIAISVWCEAAVLRRWLPQCPHPVLFRSVIRANLASYGLLAAFCIAILLWALAARI